MYVLHLKLVCDWNILCNKLRPGSNQYQFVMHEACLVALLSFMKFRVSATCIRELYVIGLFVLKNEVLYHFVGLT